MRAMVETSVWVFFYGSYINLDVLRGVNLIPSQWEVARLAGFDIRIEPRANLVRSERDSVYGLLARTTHTELLRLHVHAKEILGEFYMPYAVLVETLAGTCRPALCYLCHDMAPRPADPAYIDRITIPARELGFPPWYLARIERFRPAAAE